MNSISDLPMSAEECPSRKFGWSCDGGLLSIWLEECFDYIWDLDEDLDKRSSTSLQSIIQTEALFTML